MESFRIGVMKGDGIGEEVVGAAVRVLRAAVRDKQVEFELVQLPMGWEAIDECDDPMPEGTLTELENCHGWIMGPHNAVSYPARLRGRNPSSIVRLHFDLYANIRPARTYEGADSLAEEADLVIVRENTEGFYADRNMYCGEGELMPTPGVVLSVGLFTQKAAERIAHSAFELARERRSHVTLVHKASVIPRGHGLFVETCRDVAEEYPEVEVDELHIDAMAAHLVRRPADFDVVLTTNMIGDILSDLAGELVGSLGLAPALNAGEEKAMAQAAHGSAPDIAGQGIANPVAELVSTAMLMHWMSSTYDQAELAAVGTAIEQAVAAAIASGVSTPDVGGDASTIDFTNGVIAHL